MNELEYRWLVYFIGIEFFLVLAFIIICYLTKLYFIQKNIKETKQVKELEAFLLKNKRVPEQYLNQIELLLDVFQNLDHREIPEWEQDRVSIMRTQILPHARHYIESKQWEKHYLLVLCYSYFIELEDNGRLIQLINDENSIVSFNAMKIASKIATKDLLKTILFRLSEESHPYHAVVIREFVPSEKWGEVILEELNASSDPWLKKICYEILDVVGANPTYFELAKTDCFSTIINLRLAAIRVLPYTDKTQYFEIYKQLMHDENWMVRNTIVKTLRDIKDPISLDLLADSLNDSVWWVRVNAAKTLAYLGDAGQLILAEYKGTKNMEGYEEANYFLRIQRIRTDPNYD